MSKRRRGTPAPATGAATVKDVAQLAGVSTATVSRTLSGVSAVKEPLRTRVLEAARQLGYQPNRAARELRAGGSRTIGVLIPDIENPFFTSVVQGIEEALQPAGYTLLLANFNEDSEREATHLAKFRAEGVGGLIFVPSQRPAPLYRSLVESGLPMVAVSRTHHKLRVDQVSVANRDGAYAATTHLVKQGHTRIGLITGPKVLNSSGDRRQGYADALHDGSIEVDERMIVHCEFRQQPGYEAMRGLLDARLHITAVLTGSNLLTLGALQAIHEAGLEIPDEIAIVGFDEMAWAISLRPPLTTVGVPAAEVGRRAAELLLQRITQPDLPRQNVLLETKLTVRGSSLAQKSSVISRTHNAS